MRRYLRRRLSRKTKVTIALLALALALLSLVLAAMSHLRPILTGLATSRVANTVTRIVTAAVNETIYAGGVDYDSLIVLEKDADGLAAAGRARTGDHGAYAVGRVARRAV